VSPPMNTRRLSCHVVEMSLVQRTTGATCRGCPRRRLLAELKCRRRANCKRPCAIRPWARARVKRFAPPEKTSRRSTILWHPTGLAPPSRRDPRPAKTTLREGRRSSRRPPTTSMMDPTAPTPTLCRGTDCGEVFGLSVDAERTAGGGAKRCPVVLAASVVAGPQMFTCPSSSAGATIQPRLSQKTGGQPPSKRGSMLSSLRRQSEAGQPPSWLA
jgi:hypothetical protein